MWYYLAFLSATWTLSQSLLSVPGVYQLTEPVDHAEAPTWDGRTGVLYFVNIHEGEIYRFDFQTDEITSIKLNGEIAPVIPSKSNANLLIAGLNRSVVAVEWDGVNEPSPTRILNTVSQQFPTSRFNDGKADKQGRLWIGTMGYEGPEGLTPDEGVLYKVTCGNLHSPEAVVAPVNISNGMAWNSANTVFFYIDTPTRQVVAYDYEDATGTISNKRVIFDVTQHDRITGSPDGMTIDREDNLWVALYGGGAVVKVASTTGDLLQIIAIPAEAVTSAIWGGPDLDVLFVTTSRYGLDAEGRRRQPAAGSVFAVVGLATQGVPGFDVDLISTIDDEECGGDSI